MVGFPGPTLDAETARALTERRRSGVILFRRNVESVDSVYELCRRLIAATASEHGPFIAVDQEGGRVIRIPPPPYSYRRCAISVTFGRPGLCRRAGAAVGSELLAMGINVDFRAGARRRQQPN